MDTPIAKPGPLSGLAVVELGDGTAAPFAAKMLADYGAEVVKVEPPGGDSSRRRGPFPDDQEDHELSGLFQYLNSNKLGIVLDLDEDADREAMAALLVRADIFVTDAPIDRLERASIAPAALRRQCPRLIVATLSPFGRTGLWADRAGDEIVTYAMGGIAYATPGMPDAAADLADEPPLHPSCFASETISGIVAATAILAAIHGRDESGEGCHVDLSAQAAVAAMQQRDITNTSYLGNRYTRVLDPVTIGRMPNFYLPCKDGYVVVAAPLDMHWARLVEAMQRPNWAVGEDFATQTARTENWRALRERLMEWTITLTGDELHDIALRTQLPIFPYYPMRKTIGSDHMAARGSLVDIEIGGRPAKMPAAPVAMSGSPWSMRRPAPRLGEHTVAVLASLRQIA